MSIRILFVASFLFVLVLLPVQRLLLVFSSTDFSCGSFDDPLRVFVGGCLPTFDEGTDGRGVDLEPVCEMVGHGAFDEHHFVLFEEFEDLEYGIGVVDKSFQLRCPR